MSSQVGPEIAAAPEAADTRGFFGLLENVHKKNTALSNALLGETGSLDASPAKDGFIESLLKPTLAQHQQSACESLST